MSGFAFDILKSIEGTQFYTCSVTQITDLFNSIPEYVIKATFALAFVIVFLLFIIIMYYIYKKFDSINEYIKSQKDENRKISTFKKRKKEYKKAVGDLGARILPENPDAFEVAEIIREYLNKK